MGDNSEKLENEIIDNGQMVNDNKRDTDKGINVKEEDDNGNEAVEAREGAEEDSYCNDHENNEKNNTNKCDIKRRIRRYQQVKNKKVMLDTGKELKEEDGAKEVIDSKSKYKKKIENQKINKRSDIDKEMNDKEEGDNGKEAAEASEGLEESNENNVKYNAKKCEDKRRSSKKVIQDPGKEFE